MKAANLPFFLLSLSLVLLGWGCDSGSESSSASKKDLNLLVDWTPMSEKLDSIPGCSENEPRTRYLSRLPFTLDVQGMQDLIGMGDTLLLKFQLRAKLPGELCQEGLILSILALGMDTCVVDPTESYPAIAHKTSCKQGKSADFEACVEIKVKFPLDSTDPQNAKKVGLCIILETIDPKTRFIPVIESLSDFSGTVGDTVFALPDQAIVSACPITQIPSPHPPECASCKYPGSR